MDPSSGPSASRTPTLKRRRITRFLPRPVAGVERGDGLARVAHEGRLVVAPVREEVRRDRHVELVDARLRRVRVGRPDVALLREADGDVLLERVRPPQEDEVRRPLEEDGQVLPLEVLAEELEADDAPPGRLGRDLLQEPQRRAPPARERPVAHAHVPREAVLGRPAQVAPVEGLPVHQDLLVRPQHLHEQRAARPRRREQHEPDRPAVDRRPIPRPGREPPRRRRAEQAEDDCADCDRQPDASAVHHERSGLPTIIIRLLRLGALRAAPGQPRRAGRGRRAPDAGDTWGPGRVRAALRESPSGVGSRRAEDVEDEARHVR